MNNEYELLAVKESLSNYPKNAKNILLLYIFLLKNNGASKEIISQRLNTLKNFSPQVSKIITEIQNYNLYRSTF